MEIDETKSYLQRRPTNGCGTTEKKKKDNNNSIRCEDR